MAAKVNIDMVYYTPLQEVLQALEEHEGVIYGHVAHGPGGGNPMLRVAFPTREKAIDYLETHYPDDDVSWLHSLITEEKEAA